MMKTTITIAAMDVLFERQTLRTLFSSHVVPMWTCVSNPSRLHRAFPLSLALFEYTFLTLIDFNTMFYIIDCHHLSTRFHPSIPFHLQSKYALNIHTHTDHTSHPRIINRPSQVIAAPK